MQKHCDLLQLEVHLQKRSYTRSCYLNSASWTWARSTPAYTLLHTFMLFKLSILNMSSMLHFSSLLATPSPMIISYFTSFYLRNTFDTFASHPATFLHVLIFCFTSSYLKGTSHFISRWERKALRSSQIWGCETRNKYRREVYTLISHLATPLVS